MMDLELRVAALEIAVKRLQDHLAKASNGQRHWWRDDAGRFMNDPEFEEMVRLGREYRESLRPDYRKKKSKKK